MTKGNPKEEKQIESKNLSEESSSGPLVETSKSSQEAKLPGILEYFLPDEVKENIPINIKKQISLAFSLESRREVSPWIDLADKVQPSHITQFLENDNAQDERVFQDSQISKRYTLTYVIIFCFVFLFTTVFLVNQNVNIYTDLLRTFVVFAGGFGSGLGYKNLKDKNKG
ncbi:MAG: hypothetical protein F6K40_20240 [Okeania sp. SIO3I5]|uniref:hypothetical protein n=1 Tax=Okeania sp. SIO3I5 TaxID=2607805 RepID=UPI0013B8EC59|nr:hypothetical protein [Okeania sp. SIO3I5]NEQ38470.1 hypothetical protein [Okeania sp. SIO3I5]